MTAESDSRDSEDHDPLHEIVDEYIARIHEGNAPSLEEYVDKHPQQADRLRDILV